MGEKISSLAQKTRPWYPLGVCIKISDKYPYSFYMGVTLPRGLHFTQRSYLFFDLVYDHNILSG